MKKLITISLSLTIVSLSCFFLAFTHKKDKVLVAENGFAVVELFTSEGCSSCPPADEAVIQLIKDHPKNVFVLGYHVDYWNYIGWTDAFSKPSFTDRQRQYADKFSLSSIYTPQIIINGKKELVGSNRGLLQSTVQSELTGNNSIPVKLVVKNENNQTISVLYDAGEANGAILNIALVQLKAESSVKRGENKGKLLQHIDIVRDFKTITASKKISGTMSFAFPKDIPANGLKIVAFLQNKNDWKITGAVEAFL